jgi:hypothetical protein
LNFLCCPFANSILKWLQLIIKWIFIFCFSHLNPANKIYMLLSTMNTPLISHTFDVGTAVNFGLFWLYNKQLCNLYSSPNTFWVTKRRKGEMCKTCIMDVERLSTKDNSAVESEKKTPCKTWH